MEKLTMKTQDLRYGNYVFDTSLNKNTQIYAIEEPELTWLKPIKLTEQWLIDFSFTKHGIVFIKGDIIICNISDYEFQVGLYKGNNKPAIYLPVYCKYVNHFQNIIYDLTGKELTKQP